MHCLSVEGPVLSPSFSSWQINGIALDNKSLTECEALLRSCRDSLSLSLMKVWHTQFLIHFSPSFMPNIFHRLAFFFSTSDIVILHFQLNYLMNYSHLMWLILSSVLLHSSSRTAHQARTSLKAFVSHRRSPTGAFTCLRYTHGTAATSNTTARHRPTSSAPMSAAPAQVASPEREGRSEVNLMKCTVTSASRSLLFPSMPQASDLPLTWALVAMGLVLSKSAVPTRRRLPPCPLTLSLPQTACQWRLPWKRSTAVALGLRWWSEACRWHRITPFPLQQQPSSLSTNRPSRGSPYLIQTLSNAPKLHPLSWSTWQPIRLQQLRLQLPTPHSLRRLSPSLPHPPLPQPLQHRPLAATLSSLNTSIKAAPPPTAQSPQTARERLLSPSQQERAGKGASEKETGTVTTISWTARSSLRGSLAMRTSVELEGRSQRWRGHVLNLPRPYGVGWPPRPSLFPPSKWVSGAQKRSRVSLIKK